MIKVEEFMGTQINLMDNGDFEARYNKILYKAKSLQALKTKMRHGVEPIDAFNEHIECVWIARKVSVLPGTKSGVYRMAGGRDNINSFSLYVYDPKLEAESEALLADMAALEERARELRLKLRLFRE